MAKYRFEDIAINSTQKKKPTEEDKYTYLGLEHLDSGTLKVSRFGSEVAPIGEKLIMKKGDVLFGKRRAYQKKVAIAPFDGIFSAHGMVLRPKTEVIDPDFFPLFISSDYFLDAAIKISVGSLSPTINWKDLRELEFELPSLEKQKELAKLLWSMQDTIEAYRDLFTKTDELLKSEFLKTIGDNPEMRELASFGTIGTGTTPTMKKAEYYENDDIPFVKPSDMDDDSIDIIYDSEFHIDNRAEAVARIVDKDSLLVTCIGSIGKMAITGNRCTCNQQINYLIPNSDVSVVYVAYALKSRKKELIDYAKAPVVPIINKTDFSKFRIPFIDYVSQIEIESFIKKTNKTKETIKYSILELQNSYKKILETIFINKEEV